jgi:hypothetical protein
MTDINTEKTKTLVTEESLSCASGWQPGWRQTPWLTMASILLMLACMGAIVGILIASDGQIVGTWKIEPAVLLAFLSSAWNYSLGIVLARSVAITWWRSALKGTTLESLHYIWDQRAGPNPFYALQSSLIAWKVVLLAWLVVSVQIINNPLLQRSTRIGAENIAVQDQLTLDIAPSLPDGFLGTVEIALEAGISGSRNGLSTTQDWWWNKTILTANTTGNQCNGTCTGLVQATGIDYNCSSTTIALDFSAQENIGQVIFAINTTLTWNATGAPILILTTLRSSAIDNSCTSTIVITTCAIEAAILEYPVQVQNATVTLQQDKLQNATVVSKYVSPGDLATATKGQGAGPLEGLNDFLGNYLFANVTLIIDSSRNASLYSGGLIQDLFFLPDASYYDASIFHRCGLEWSDPTQYVIDSMYEFLFRASVRASEGTDSQTFDVQRAYLVLVFNTNYQYLATALTVMLITLFAVLFRLWGWWELGRHVSLSPLELAKAFRAPVMQRAGENSAVPGILKRVGKTRVQYDGESITETSVVELLRAEDI